MAGALTGPLISNQPLLIAIGCALHVHVMIIVGHTFMYNYTLT